MLAPQHLSSLRLRRQLWRLGLSRSLCSDPSPQKADQKSAEQRQAQTWATSLQEVGAQAQSHLINAWQAASAKLQAMRRSADTAAVRSGMETTLSKQEHNADGAAIARNRVEKAISRASQHLNELTGYTTVAELKALVEAAGQALTQARLRAAEVKQGYDSLLNAQLKLQRDLNRLLECKSSWTEEDLHRFTQLCGSEHKMDAQVAAAKDASEAAATAVEEAQVAVMQAIRERYTEEQLWGDKIRRASTWWTWSLMVLQLLSFCGVVWVIEPRRVRLLQEHMGRLLEEQERKTAATVKAIVAGELQGVMIAGDGAPIMLQGLVDVESHSSPTQNNLHMQHQEHTNKTNMKIVKEARPLLTPRSMKYKIAEDKTQAKGRRYQLHIFRVVLLASRLPFQPQQGR
ncbi:hypothetical protein QJQ45_028769 [Haematococcus lacustris]|nr:hypothetical protein QJQ45_028769 [Haematococcus lacustris]